jgi:hypothetical protein
MKTNEEIKTMTTGYTMMNYLHSFMISVSGKNLFQYKGIKFDTYEDNIKSGDYWVFFNTELKKALVFIKNA